MPKPLNEKEIKYVEKQIFDYRIILGDRDEELNYPEYRLLQRFYAMKTRGIDSDYWELEYICPDSWKILSEEVEEIRGYMIGNGKIIEQWFSSEELDEYLLEFEAVSD